MPPPSCLNDQRNRLALLALIASLLVAPGAAESQSDEVSWLTHAAAGGAMALAVDLVIDHPTHAALVSIGVTVGHEIGQFRERERWSTDSTMDIVSGTIGAVAMAWWRARRRAEPDGASSPEAADPATTTGHRVAQPHQAPSIDRSPLPITANTLLPSIAVTELEDRVSGESPPSPRERNHSCGASPTRGSQ